MLRSTKNYPKKRGAELVLHAQCRASGFYEKSGFEKLGDADDDEGCPHIWMKKHLK